MTIVPQATTDPLGAFTAGAFAALGRRPIPLISTSFDVDVVGGLATVSTKRVFRNTEADSIEATITFPIPVHAVLFALEARIDGRIVRARAQRRTHAREIYEDAVERGKAAVLHEEVLRGVHMLSIAHLAPGAEIEVSSTWAAALSYFGDRGRLRIPLTVGDIYGRSGLPDSDEMVHGGPTQHGDLTVHCDGVVELLGAGLDNGRTRVPLNAPIDLIVTQSVREALRGQAADGREVILRIRPHTGGDGALDAALLIDHSGSMAEPCSGSSGSLNKHQTIVRGLMSVAECLGEADRIDLWEFDDSLSRIGSTRDEPSNSHSGTPRKQSSRERLLRLVEQLGGPEGGTEIGAALHGTIGRSEARDVLLITDGNSHALDVQALARQGRRISVVLVGEDSLEANVGHLAALTGGDILVAAGADIAEVLATALGSLRAPFERPQPIDGPPHLIRTVRGNAILEAEWRPAASPVGEHPEARAVAALAASLALCSLDEEAASSLAEAEGLVTHLTSLVLVDDAGEAQAGLPATRKIALPTPRTSPVFMDAACAYRMVDLEAPAICRSAVHPIARPAGADSRDRKTDHLAFDLSEIEGTYDLSQIGGRIDWARAPNRLREGDLSYIDPDVASLIERVAALPQVVAAARRLNVTPVAFVLALLARADSAANRSAGRFARVVLGHRIPPEFEALSDDLGLAHA